MTTPSDRELLDWLEAQNRKGRYTGRCLFRLSTTGRVWRLHETSEDGAECSVRAAIAQAMGARLVEVDARLIEVEGR